VATFIQWMYGHSASQSYYDSMMTFLNTGYIIFSHLNCWVSLFEVITVSVCCHFGDLPFWLSPLWNCQNFDMYPIIHCSKHCLKASRMQDFSDTICYLLSTLGWTRTKLHAATSYNSASH